MEKARRDLGWLPPVCHKRALAGFTLAELLICIAILGVIATFTIPKIMAGQQNKQYNAAAHEVAAMLSSALQQAQLDGKVTAATVPGDLTQYMNYVSVQTTGSIDYFQTATTMNCLSTRPCLKLHNGGILSYTTTWGFGGTSSTNVVQFWFDPDGVVTDGTTNGPGKSIIFELTYTGRVLNYGSGNTYCGSWGCPFSGGPGVDPPWFSW